MSLLEIMDFSNLLDFQKVYNNDNILFLCFNVCPSPRVILCCIPHRFVVWLGTHYDYHTRAWLVPKSETQDFDSWLTSSLRIECNFPLATSDIQMKQNFIPRLQINKNDMG